MRVRGWMLSLGFCLAVGSIAHADAPAGNADKGKTIFNRCKVCHTFEAGAKGRIGPNLWGVVGRKAGSTDYNYSGAMKKAGEGGLTWTPDKLDAYLTDPKALVPGNKMTFAGLPSAQDRADVVAYLSTGK